MITRRTVLIYNLGLVLALLVCGLLTMYALALLGDPSGANSVQASAQARAAKEMQDDQDLEQLRATASFYLRLSQDLQRARYADNVDSLKDIRYGCFLMAALFTLGALLGFASAQPDKKPPKDVPKEPT